MTLDIPNLNTESKEEDLISACHELIQNQGDNSEGRGLQLNYLLGVLNLKRQKKLIEDQNEFNIKLVNTNKSLAKATWVLALVTMALALITYFR